MRIVCAVKLRGERPTRSLAAPFLMCADMDQSSSPSTLAASPAQQPAGEDPSKSLSEVHRSIEIPPAVAGGRRWWRRMLGFAGPGFLVSVGYMDPGNWGTDLEGGSRYGYQLLWVIMLSNLMAIFLQTLSARLGIATGRDLAQSCREYYSRPVAIALWILCEIAIVACDLAEVVGAAVALNLLLGIKLAYGVLLTGFDVLLLLMLMKFGFRVLEAVVVTLVLTIAACFAYNMYLANPDWTLAAKGVVTPVFPDSGAVLVSLGILGATVMPHNLYLHSSIVQTRRHDLDHAGKAAAIRYNTVDTAVALGAAFFINAAILVLAAAIFHNSGTEVTELQQAHELLGPALGGAGATAFAVALLASGQSSTITGTLAGQIVMEGFLNIRIRPWLRRLITRSLAIIPALIVVLWTDGHNTVNLLVISQVVLSMQLPFAIFPLVAITSDSRRMGRFASQKWAVILGYTLATVITGLNIYVLWEQIGPLGVITLAALFAGFTVWIRTRKPRPVAA